MAIPAQPLDQGDVENVEVQPERGYLDFFPPVVKETAKKVATFAVATLILGTLFKVITKFSWKDCFLLVGMSYIGFFTAESIFNKIFGEIAPQTRPEVEYPDIDEADYQGPPVYERELVLKEYHLRNSLPINRLTQRQLQIIRLIDVESINQDGSLKYSAYASLPLLVHCLIRPILQRLSLTFFYFYLAKNSPLSQKVIEKVCYWQSSAIKWPTIIKIVEYLFIASDETFKKALKDKRELYHAYQAIRDEKARLEDYFAKNPVQPEIQDSDVEAEVEEIEQEVEHPEDGPRRNVWHAGPRNLWQDNITKLAAANLRLKGLETTLPPEAMANLKKSYQPRPIAE